VSLPVFHLLAGPNGAGKSTLFRALVASGTIEQEVEFVNADLYERDHLQHIADLQKRSEVARVWADGRRDELLQFSHDSKLSLISRAQTLGFSVVLYVVSVDDPLRLLTRVNQRVEEGGHNVPAERILQRYPRTMVNLKLAVRLADLAFVYDAVDIEQGGHRLVALCEKEQTTLLVDQLPPWAVTMLDVK